MDFDGIISIIDDAAGKKGVQFEINLVNVKVLKMEAENSAISNYVDAETNGFNLRLLDGKRMSFSYCSGFDEEKTVSTFENAYSLLKYMDDNEYAGIAPKDDSVSLLSSEGLGIFSSKFEDVDINLKKAALIDMESTAYSYDKRIYKVDKPSYSESLARKRFYNSNGVDLNSTKTYYEVFLSAASKSGEDTGSGFDFDFSHDFDSLKFKKVSMNASKKAVDQLGAVSTDSGIYNVVFDNFTSSEFLSILKQSFYAGNVFKKKSLIAGKIGKKIFSDKLDIIDDGLLPNGISTDLFDAEGTVMQKKDLCTAGVVGSYLYDIEYARRFNVKSTGNSLMGSLTSPPEIGATNFYIKNGPVSLIDIIGSMKEGLFINELMGLHMAKPYTGEFSLGASGFYVKRGRMEFPVKGIVISGNLMQLFNNIVTIGNDLRFFGHTGSPSILFENVNVSGK